MTEATTVLAYSPPASSGLSHRLRALADIRGLWSLGDQAILSLGNFFTGWLLLRSTSPWYGDYFRIIVAIYFLNNLHMAMVTYPISVTSAGISDSDLRRRIRRAIGMTLLLLIPESAICAFCTIAITTWRLLPWVVAALVFWQLQETVRRALMARLEHRRAMLGDMVSYLGQAAAVALVIHHGTITIEMAFGIIAATSFAAMLVQILQLRLHAAGDSPSTETLTHQAKNHLSLGQWILLGNAMNLLTVYSIPWVVGYFHGKTGVAAYSAVLFVLNASNPLLASVANLITPVVAKLKAEAHARGETGLQSAQRAALKYSIQGALLLFPCFAFLAALPGFALHIFYKPDSPYLQLATPLRIFTIAYMLMYVSAMMNSYLCGLGKSRLPFFGQAANAMVTCVITLPLVAKFGLLGAAWGSIFPAVVQIVFGAWFVHTSGREPRESASQRNSSFPLNVEKFAALRQR